MIRIKSKSLDFHDHSQSAAAACSSDDGFSMDEHLQSLLSMGFLDQDLNRRLLIQTQNDIGEVVTLLTSYSYSHYQENDYDHERNSSSMFNSPLKQEQVDALKKKEKSRGKKRKKPKESKATQKTTQDKKGKEKRKENKYFLEFFSYLFLSSALAWVVWKKLSIEYSKAKLRLILLCFLALINENEWRPNVFSLWFFSSRAKQRTIQRMVNRQIPMNQQKILKHLRVRHFLPWKKSFTGIIGRFLTDVSPNRFFLCGNEDEESFLSLFLISPKR